MPRRKTAPTHRRMIRTGYHWLSLANTLSVLLTFDPARIAKHLIRKRAIRTIGKIGSKR